MGEHTIKFAPREERSVVQARVFVLWRRGRRVETLFFGGFGDEGEMIEVALASHAMLWPTVESYREWAAKLSTDRQLALKSYRMAGIHMLGSVASTDADPRWDGIEPEEQ